MLYLLFFLIKASLSPFPLCKVHILEGEFEIFTTCHLAANTI